MHSWVSFLERHKIKENASGKTEHILPEEKANDPSPRIEHATKPVELPHTDELPEKDTRAKRYYAHRFS